MRNYAEEILFIETARAEQSMQRLRPAISHHGFSRSGNSTSTARPVLRARWVLVDETLKLVWSEDREEPLRRAA